MHFSSRESSEESDNELQIEQYEVSDLAVDENLSQAIEVPLEPVYFDFDWAFLPYWRPINHEYVGIQTALIFRISMNILRL